MIALADAAGKTVDDMGQTIVDGLGRPTTAMRKYMEQINASSGTAARISQQMNDTTGGELRRLKSAWEDVGSSVGDLFLPAIRGASVGLTGVANGISWFVQTFPTMSKGVALVGGGIVTLAVSSLVLGYAFNPVRTGLNMARGACCCSPARKWPPWAPRALSRSRRTLCWAAPSGALAKPGTGHSVMTTKTPEKGLPLRASRSLGAHDRRGLMRRAALSLIYEGRDISADLAPDLLSLTFTDKSGAKGETDDLQVVISDRDRLWQDAWCPQRGHTMQASIVCTDWFALGDCLELPCGAFEVDEVEFEAGETDTVTIKGVPAAVKTSLAGQKKTRAWNSATLETIAGDIAREAGLTLLYRGDAISLQRVEQRQEQDLAFLHRIGGEHGCRVKVSSRQIVVYSGSGADGLEPVTLDRGNTGSFRGKITTAEVYSSCTVTFTDPAAAATPPASPCNPPWGTEMELEQVQDLLAQCIRVGRVTGRQPETMRVQVRSITFAPAKSEALEGRPCPVVSLSVRKEFLHDFR